MLNKLDFVDEFVDLTNYNTYGIKTKTKYLAKPRNLDDLKKLMSYIKNNNIKYFVIGGGSNIILSDSTFDGIIISLEYLNSILINDTKVVVEAGISLSKFIMECINNSLGGLEYLALIPGTLGGTLYGNAGVSDKCIYDFIESVTVLRAGNIITLNKDDIVYSYRYSMFKDNHDIIVGATFELYNEDVEKMKEFTLLYHCLNEAKMKEIVKENRIKRLNSQPLEYKNAGSVFKNPPSLYAGKLIESLKLKGFNVGDAEVSAKHANFIINKGNATGSDIRKLIKIIQEKVYDEYKIKLELEQIIIDWE